MPPPSGNKDVWPCWPTRATTNQPSAQLQDFADET